MATLAFDAKRIFNNFTGLGNYSRTLVKNLQARFPKHQYLLFTPYSAESPESAYFEQQEKFKVIIPESRFTALWRTYGIISHLEKHGVELYHGLSNELPANIHRSKIKAVVTIHDLIFRQHPEQYPVFDRHIYDWKFKRSCRDADLVIAISESTRQDILAQYKVPEDRVKVVYQSCAPAFYAPPVADERLASLRKKYGLPEDYLLYVGTVNERKNLLNIVKAVEMKPQSPPLVVVGSGKEYERKVREYLSQKKLESRVIWAQEVTNEELPGVYQGAMAFLYPSLYEGFGIPVVEALLRSTPVITGNVSSLPEAGGPDSIYVDPTKPEAIAAAVEKVVGDAALRDRMAQKGLKYAKKFSPEAVSIQMMGLYQELLGG